MSVFDDNDDDPPAPLEYCPMCLFGHMITQKSTGIRHCSECAYVPDNQHGREPNDDDDDKQG